ncbi:histidine--tRNA ligase [Pseudovibrio exalbescens]|uniref:Histidine--tRNA ligase n=1 Tax=Pseudovibrio exalbescens TaxID=197461 RepID=A0A1U7JCI6_9HYPH|nr:histidine--tRNA ligase [Pseudovibrio exalbescens]OKL42443.1 histidine--tRNA ligase [Pseudovibrio exalbescens]
MAKKKSAKLKARLPRGFVDRGPSELLAMDRMLKVIKDTYELYGFEPVETPQFEYTDALGKFLPDQDRPNAGVFSLQDDDEQWMSLRYDLTAPLARHVAENFDHLPKPYRSYRAGYVFRNEKPGPGRFRQFMQFDADTIGAPSVSADAEICMMASDTMERLGIARGDYVIRVNNRKVLDGVMEVIGLAGDEHAERRLTVLRAVDKLDRLGVEGVRLLLGEGRKDDSGDFTKGAGLDDKAADVVLAFVEAGAETAAGTIDNLRKLIVDSTVGAEGVEELATMAALFDAAGYSDGRVLIDPSVVRGLEYYTGPVYEAELTFEVKDEKGNPVRFGSVGGGGRYDGLVSRFMSQPVPSTGFSVGVSRLMAALKVLGKLGDEEILGPVVVCVMDRDTESLSHYMRMVQELRTAGIRSEMFQGNPKQFGKQLQYADKRNSPCAIIQGSQEREAGEIQIKDLIEGKRLSEEIEDNKTWRESRPAQFAVKTENLVEEVLKLLKSQEQDRQKERES